MTDKACTGNGGFMKFVGFPKFALLFALASVLTLTLAGCGAAVSNLALTQGNWAVTATSTAPKNVAGPTFVLGGNLTQNGNALSGTLSIVGSGCITPQTIAFTGKVDGKNITLTSATFDGIVITVKASGAKDSLTGTYTVTGGCPDQGTLTAGAVPSITGIWNGTIANGDTSTGISAALTQAATASQDGTFALTGTLTYTGSTCTAPATLVASSIAGSDVTISADSGFLYPNVPLDSITNPKSMTGSYDNSSDPCAATDGSPVTLTKQ